jgi:hypothetical protein
MIGSIASSALSVLYAVGGAALESLSKVSRTLCISILSNIRKGRFEILDHDGTVYTVGGDEKSDPSCTLQVHASRFWVRLAIFADMVGSRLNITQESILKLYLQGLR